MDTVIGVGGVPESPPGGAGLEEEPEEGLEEGLDLESPPPHALSSSTIRPTASGSHCPNARNLFPHSRTSTENREHASCPKLAVTPRSSHNRCTQPRCRGKP